MILFYIYITIVIICFVSSLINPKARQNFLWLYFGLVFFLETSFLIFKLISYSVYIFSMPIYTLFFIFYFSLQSIKKTSYYIIAFLTIIGSFIFYENINNQIIMGVIMSIVYLYLGLSWFAKQLKNPDITPIYKKQSFWISTTLLLTAIIFIFRFIPMNFFEIEDKEFLKLINTSFQYSVIISYLLFLKATICKA